MEDEVEIVNKAPSYATVTKDDEEDSSTSSCTRTTATTESSSSPVFQPESHDESTSSQASAWILTGSNPFCIYVSTTTNIETNDHDATPSVIDDDEMNSHPSSRRRRRRIPSSLRVAIDEDYNVYHENLGALESDPGDVWYSQEDYAKFRFFATNLAGTMTRLASTGSKGNMVRALVKLLTKSYLACCIDFSDEYDEENLGEDVDVDEISDVSECKMNQDYLSEDEERMLCKLYHDIGGTALVGLEKAIVRQISKDVHVRRKELALAVEEVQQSDPQWLGSAATTDLAMELRQSCEMLSRPSKLFAQRMAQVHLNLC
ncbi:hypothetical protein ACA910_012462 [Epithemia clementina (nom. ined.)]